MSEHVDRHSASTTSSEYAHVSSSAEVPLLNARASPETRVQQFLHLLKQPQIDIKQLKQLAYHGIPDVKGLRATVWKVLFNQLSSNPQAWGKELETSRRQYEQFCRDVLINPKADSKADVSAQAAAVKRVDVTSHDHPLSSDSTSKWNHYFKDHEIVEQIEMDVDRTHPELQFFSGASATAAQHRTAMKRALRIYARLNPGLTYVQGMNELYAPLYYIFRNDADPQHAQHAEADAFFCFLRVIGECRDLYCSQLDNSSVGVRARLAELSSMLRGHDSALWHHLEVTNGVNAQFYAFRWITLLLTQEFVFPDVLRIWDALMSDEEGVMAALLRTCCAMLLCARDALLAGDFSQNMKLLQQYPNDISVDAVLAMADALRRRNRA